MAGVSLPIRGQGVGRHGARGMRAGGCIAAILLLPSAVVFRLGGEVWPHRCAASWRRAEERFTGDRVCGTGMANHLEGEMLNVIEFLERLGADARLRHASRDDLLLALSDTPIEQSVREAFLAADAVRMRAWVGEATCFGILMPGREEEEESGEEEDEEDVPPEEHIHSLLHSGCCAVAPQI